VLDSDPDLAWIRIRIDRRGWIRIWIRIHNPNQFNNIIKQYWPDRIGLSKKLQNNKANEVHHEYRYPGKKETGTNTGTGKLSQHISTGTGTGTQKKENVAIHISMYSVPSKEFILVQKKKPSQHSSTNIGTGTGQHAIL
jgi:hypothetical protein